VGVILDTTSFYYESGGQIFDTGALEVPPRPITRPLSSALSRPPSRPLSRPLSNRPRARGAPTHRTPSLAYC